MLVDKNLPCCAVTTVGIKVHIESGCIVDCTDLANEFKHIKISLNQTRERGRLLGEAHGKERGKHQ